MSSTDISELTETWIGPTLVALVSGIRDRALVASWCDGSTEPDKFQERRLSFALEVLRQVATDEASHDLARSWFIGENTTVGDESISPCEAIRIDHFDAVRISARRFRDDVWE